MRVYKNSGMDIDNDFVEVNKIVEASTTSKRVIDFEYGEIYEERNVQYLHIPN